MKLQIIVPIYKESFSVLKPLLDSIAISLTPGRLEEQHNAMRYTNKVGSVSANGADHNQINIQHKNSRTITDIFLYNGSTADSYNLRRMWQLIPVV